MTREGALERWARERPEAPFVFFRGRRGHFRWLSYATARSFPPVPRPGPGSDDWAPPEVDEIVAAARAAVQDPPTSPALAPPAAGRDVWITWRPLAVPEEAALADFAIRSGAAILAERSDGFPLELFLWARPTVVSGSAAELAALLDGVEGEAPRLLRRRWLRQRLGRLRLVLVEGASETSEIEELRLALRGLLPDSTAAVRPFPRLSV